MARYSRRKTTTTPVDWKAFYVEAINKGMHDYFTGNVGTNLQASAARLMGSTASEATNYSNSKYYQLGVEVAKMQRTLAMNNVLWPQSEGELGRLILGEETNFVEAGIDMADNFVDDPFGVLAEAFGVG